MAGTASSDNPASDNPGPDNPETAAARASAEAANALGNQAMARGDARAAQTHFAAAAAADPGQPALLFNLSAAARAAGDRQAALAALDAALAADPYFVQAMFQRAILLEELGDPRGAAQQYRDFLDTVPPEVDGDPRYAAALGRAREAVAADGAALAGMIAAGGAAPTRRLAGAIASLASGKPVFRAEPTFLTIPELPAVPFLDRAMLPWLAKLEAATAAITGEALALIAAHGDSQFVPYVANPPGTALNQWAALDHSRDWSALFLWHHGARNDANCAAMPQAAALLEGLPLLELQRRGPNAFLSRLAPHTKIPAHHGVTNARVTVHLPLIVPPGCGFRVGAEMREWRVGEAWAFDDTIEHEAWNDSDQPRLILILDTWNPYLNAAECIYLANALAAYDRHLGREDLRGTEI